MSIQSSNTLRRAALPCLTVAAMVGMLLSGCSYRMDRTDNPVKMPVAWDAALTPDAKPGIAKDWWNNFGSRQLDGLIQEALKGNPSIIATEERMKQAERTFSQAHDGLFPDLSVSASTSKSHSAVRAEGNSGVPLFTPNGNMSTTTSGRESTSLSLSTSYTVDLWGATAARYRQSVATFIGTRWDSDLARIQLAQNIARSYFNLLSSRSQVDVARDNLKNAEEVLRIFEARYREGILREYDVTQQRTRVLQQRTNLIPQENSLRAAETALGILLGRTPQEFHIDGESINDLKVPEVAPWVPGELLLRRPDVASAETTIASQKANLAIAHANMIPISLTLSSSYGTSSAELAGLSLTDPRTFSIQGVLSLATGIFNYRGRHNSLLNAESNEYIALVNYADTIRKALKDIDDKLANVNAQLLAEQSQQETLRLAERAMQLANVQLREGTADQEDIINAQNSLESARDATARARITRLNAVIDLYVALGGGWEGPTQADLSLLQAKK